MFFVEATKDFDSLFLGDVSVQSSVAKIAASGSGVFSMKFMKCVVCLM